MDFIDIKIIGANLLAATIGFSQINSVLSFISLVVAIGYTITKWYKLKK